MDNKFASENHVTASIRDVAEFIRGYFEANDLSTKVLTAGADDQIQLSFVTTARDNVFDERNERTGAWGNAILMESRGVTLFLFELDMGEIHRLFPHEVSRETVKMRRQKILDELEAKILKQFGKPQEPLMPPHVYDKKKLEEIRKLSEDGETIVAIAGKVSLSRSQVVRYRDHLGITKKRR